MNDWFLVLGISLFVITGLKYHIHEYFDIFVLRILTHSPLNFQEFALKIKGDAPLLKNAPVEHTPVPHVIEPVHN